MRPVVASTRELLQRPPLLIAGGLAVAIALIVVVGWAWLCSVPSVPDMPVPGVSLPLPTSDPQVSDEELAAALKEIRKHLRPDEGELSGTAEERLRARVESLSAELTKAHTELDGARQTRDRLLADNDRLAAANRTLQSRLVETERALHVVQARADPPPGPGAAEPSGGITGQALPAPTESVRMPAQLVAAEPAPSGDDDALKALVRELDGKVSEGGSVVTVPLHVSFDPATGELTPKSSAALTRLAALARLYGAKTVHVGLFHSLSEGQGDDGRLLQRRVAAVSDALAAIYGVGAAITAAVEPENQGTKTAGAIEVEIRR